MIVINEKCSACGKCVQDCFPMDIVMKDKKAEPKNITCIKCGHCIAICPENAISMSDYDMSEVKEYSADDFDLSSEKLLNFMKFRRSVRQFQERPIEKESLKTIIEAGRFTPTGSNRQPVSYVVVQEKIPELTALGLESLNYLGDQILGDAQSTPLMKGYANRWKNWYGDYKKNPEVMTPLFFNASAVILVLSDSHIDGALAATSMELMSNALGLGAFYSGFFVRAAKDSEKIREFLGLENQKEVIACLVMGYPKVSYQRTVPRKKPEITWK